MTPDIQPCATYHARTRGAGRWAASLISWDLDGRRTVHWESQPTFASMQEALRVAEAELKNFRLGKTKRS